MYTVTVVLLNSCMLSLVLDFDFLVVDATKYIFYYFFANPTVGAVVRVHEILGPVLGQTFGYVGGSWDLSFTTDEKMSSGTVALHATACGANRVQIHSIVVVVVTALLGISVTLLHHRFQRSLAHAAGVPFEKMKVVPRPALGQTFRDVGAVIFIMTNKHFFPFTIAHHWTAASTPRQVHLRFHVVALRVATTTIPIFRTRLEYIVTILFTTFNRSPIFLGDSICFVIVTRCDGAPPKPWAIEGRVQRRVLLSSFWMLVALCCKKTTIRI